MAMMNETVRRNQSTSPRPMSPAMERLWRSSTFGENAPSGQLSTSRSLHRCSSYGCISDKRAVHQLNQQQEQQQKRIGPRMKLPSFEKLGISAHKPNLFDWQMREEARQFRASRSQGQVMHQRSGTQVHEGQLSQLGNTPLLTPPDDIDSIKWNNAVTNGGESARVSRRASLSSVKVIEACAVEVSSAAVQHSDRTDSPSQQTTPQPRPEKSTSRPETQEANSTGSSEALLDLGIGANITSVTSPDSLANGITVISQTLPHPLQAATNPHSAFAPTIQAIQARFDGQRPPYIKITHAVPPQFTLTNLPSSPPSTPGRQGGDDYFNLNVFANAAPVPVYHRHDGNVDKSAPPSPAPIVPPATVQVSMIERYIPPSTAQEHLAFFSEQGPSVLVDRLIELSPSGGSLMLIYPTKNGAQTFRSDHIGPLLDSLLRTMVVVYDMSSDFASSLGRLPAINQMYTFEEMQEKLSTMCRQLSRSPPSSSRQSEYSLVYANVGERPLDRAAWSEWFLQQETPRMRAALKSYWQRGQRLPTSRDGVIPATLLRDIKICVEKGKYEDDAEPQTGIEVGVFVIRRSR